MILLGVVSLAIAVCYFLLQLYLLRSWRDIAMPQAAQSQLGSPMVSVLVPMRNEEESIVSCIQSILEQDYPAFEILCLDNHSSDNSAERVAALDHERLRLISLDEYLPEDTTFKKEAIEFGVHLAKGEIILATDADCICLPSWIATMVNGMQDHSADYVVGPLKLDRMDGNFLSNYQSLTTDGLLSVTGAGLESGFLLSSFGANHGYTRESFRSVGGYRQNKEHRSGDDVFLVQDMVEGDFTVAFIKDPKATVTTFPKKSWSDFLMQNLRWISKGSALKHRTTKAVTLLSLLICLSLLVLLLAACWHPVLLWFLIGVLLLKVSADSYILRAGARFNSQKYPWYTWVASHVFQPFFVGGLAIAALILRPRWKRRPI